MIRSPFRAIAFLLALNCPLVSADQWPNWRGLANDGICQEKNIPVEWSPTTNVAWTLPLPGPAGATPVVWDDTIFLTSTNRNSALLLMAIHREGKEIWQRIVAEGNKNARGDEGNSASPSPVTDGKHVWAFFANGILGCYTVDGNEVWKFDVQDRYGKLTIQFGLTSTPVLDQGVLYQQLIHGDGNSKTREACVIALNALTGQEIWKVDRPSDAYEENEHSYASAVLYNDGKEKFLLSHGADFVVAYDLNDGHELWRCGELNKKSNYDPTLRCCVSGRRAGNHCRSQCEKRPDHRVETKWTRRHYERRIASLVVIAKNTRCAVSRDCWRKCVPVHGKRGSGDLKKEHRRAAGLPARSPRASPGIAGLRRWTHLSDRARWRDLGGQGLRQSRDHCREPSQGNHLGISGHFERSDLLENFRQIVGHQTKVKRQ